MNIDLKKIKKTFSLQSSQSSCGLACLISICKYYGKTINEEQLKIYTGTTTEGTTILGLKEAARTFSMFAEGYQGDIQSLKELKSLSILHTITNSGFSHFLVCYGFDQQTETFIIGDPAIGIIEYTVERLITEWQTNILLILEPDTSFQENNTTFKTEKYTFFKKLISPDTHILSITFILSLTTASLAFATAIFSQILIDDILPTKNVNKLISFIGLYSFVIIIGYILSYLKNIFVIRQTKVFNVRLITTFLGKVFSLPMSFFNSMRTGEVLARMKETERIQGIIISLIDSTFVEFLTLILSILFLMYYNIEIACVAALSIPLLIIISKYYAIIIKKKQKMLLTNYADFEAYSVESISGIRYIKSFVQEAFFKKRLIERYSISQETARELGKISFNYDVVVGIIGSLFSVIAIFMGAYYVMIDKIEVGELFAIITILSLTITATVSIISVIIHIQESLVSFERLHDIVSADQEKVVIGQGTTKINKLSTEFHTLQLLNVSFNYPGNILLLKDINMSISTGEIISLFGDIGEGKSTLLNLIQRFYPIKSGCISFDNINISEFILSQWRESLGVVSQSSKIFMGTVADNITLFKTEYYEELEQFCKNFELDFFFGESALNLRNVLAEGGLNLSGGQKQLIGFVRALFTESKILILDEPTSSMDKASEGLMMKVLQKIKAQRIVIMITHKPEIAKKTDCIYVLKNGLIQDAGSHEELISRDNTYSQSYKSLFE